MSVSYVDQENAVRILESGGILLMETDTLPGFHCRADLPEAVERIAALKGRDGGKPLLVLAGSDEQAARVAGPLDSRQIALCAACWPGPFSLILPAGSTLADNVTGGLETVAVRVPASETLRELILAVGFPLISTSANLAGEVPIEDLAEAAERFASRVDGIVSSGKSVPERRAGMSRSVPSSLVDATVWPPEVLRAGPLPLPPTADC